MIKTIKTTKHMRLDELIKYITMNAHTLLTDKKFYTFESNRGTQVTIDTKGNVNFSYMLYTSDDLFTVEVEEEITEDTEFHILVGIYFLEGIESYDSITFYNRSIDDVKDHNAECIYALIDNKLQLIWERETQ